MKKANRKKIGLSVKPQRSAEIQPTAENWVKSGQGELMKRFTVDVPESLHRRVKTQCAARGLKMADEIRSLLERHFPESE